MTIIFTDFFDDFCFLHWGYTSAPIGQLSNAEAAKLSPLLMTLHQHSNGLLLILKLVKVKNDGRQSGDIIAEPGRAVQSKWHLHTSLWFLLTFQVKNIGKDKKIASARMFCFF